MPFLLWYTEQTHRSLLEYLCIGTLRKNKNGGESVAKGYINGMTVTVLYPYLKG